MELKGIIMEMKHSLDKFKTKFEMAEERMSKLEIRENNTVRGRERRKDKKKFLETCGKSSNIPIYTQ